MSKCDKINQLMYSYIDNELEAGAIKEFEEHISYCMTCRQELEDKTKIIDMCKEVTEVELPSNFSKDFHNKLIITKEQESSIKKNIFMYPGLKRVLSTIAAGILLVFFTNYFYNSDLINKNEADNEIKQATSNSSEAKDSPVIKPEYAAGGAEESNVAADKADASQKNYVEKPKSSSIHNKTKESITSTGRATDEIRTCKMQFSSSIETASNKSVTLTINSSDLTATANDIATIALKNSCYEQQKNEMATDDNKKAIATEDLTINVLIPNDQYDSFISCIGQNYGESNINLSAMTSEELTDKLKSLIEQSNNLSKEIEELKIKNNTTTEEIAALEAKKAEIDREIEKIRLGNVYTNVTIILKKK